MESLAITAPELARHLEIAPQTVNRWRNGQIVPRARQAQRLEQWIKQKAAPPTLPPPLQDLNTLGIQFSADIFNLETNAQTVWIVKAGILREATRGTIGESVLTGLKNGVNFNYVFLPHTPSARTFVELQQWLASESFSGTVTGYEINDNYLSRAIGLGEGPGAWIGIEYNALQVERLHRHFDVFFALAVREYTDATHQHTQNEDGLPCWIELATPQAARWLTGLKSLCAELEVSKLQKQAFITRISGAVTRPSGHPDKAAKKRQKVAEAS